MDHTASSNTRLASVHKKTASCPVLSTVYRLMHNEWPATCRQTPRIACKYYDMRNNLRSNNGLLLKGSRIIISPSLRKVFLHDLHIENTGITMWQFTVSEHWFTGLVLTMIFSDAWYQSGYHLHFQQGSAHPRDPVWSLAKIGADFMEWNVKTYLLIVDCLSLAFPCPLQLPVLSLAT